MSKSVAETMSREVQDLTSEVVEHLREAARKSGGDANSAFHRSSQVLSRAARGLEARGRETSQFASRQVMASVQAHPLAAVAVVASVLVLLGLGAARIGARA